VGVDYTLTHKSRFGIISTRAAGRKIACTAGEKRQGKAPCAGGWKKEYLVEI
jgi:hypothetical protein